MKIISGGQTGVDRSALLFALKHDFEHGGWVPSGRAAEDGGIPEVFEMQELTEFDCFEHGYTFQSLADQYRLRTRLNICEADYTLVFRGNQSTPGTNLTLSMCRALGRPYQVVNFEREAEPLPSDVLTLNVAGPRLSSYAEGPSEVERVLTGLLLEI